MQISQLVNRTPWMEIEAPWWSFCWHRGGAISPPSLFCLQPLPLIYTKYGNIYQLLTLLGCIQIRYWIKVKKKTRQRILEMKNSRWGVADHWIFPYTAHYYACWKPCNRAAPSPDVNQGHASSSLAVVLWELGIQLIASKSWHVFIGERQWTRPPKLPTRVANAKRHMFYSEPAYIAHEAYTHEEGGAKHMHVLWGYLLGLFPCN